MLTQEAAADRARIDYKRWQAIESGRANPTVRTLCRIAEALDLSLWELLAERLAQTRLAANRGR